MNVGRGIQASGSMYTTDSVLLSHHMLPFPHHLSLSFLEAGCFAPPLPPPPTLNEALTCMHACMVYTNLASHPGPGYKANANQAVLPLCVELGRTSVSALTAMIVSKTISTLVLYLMHFLKVLKLMTTMSKFP